MGGWVDDPALPCKRYGPDLFHPDRGDPPSKVALAKKVCSICPHRGPCLEWAMEHEMTRGAGIWGGTTVEERLKMRKQQRAS